MIAKTIEAFVPVAQFGFVDGKLHQLWITPLGRTEYRPVPVVELDANRKPCVTGYLEGEDDD